MRRSFVGGVLAFLGVANARAASARTDSPPVPAWHPSFSQPLDRIVDRIDYYGNKQRDFVVFRNGTCVILAAGLTDADAKAFAFKTLSDIFQYHPDMNPSPMDDGNILVRYNHPAANVVLKDIAEAHWAEIEKRHLDGLVESEVLITPLGPNQFDAFGKQALLGRAYMFMDAQAPDVVRIERHG